MGVVYRMGAYFGHGRDRRALSLSHRISRLHSVLPAFADFQLLSVSGTAVRQSRASDGQRNLHPLAHLLDGVHDLLAGVCPERRHRNCHRTDDRWAGDDRHDVHDARRRACGPRARRTPGAAPRPSAGRCASRAVRAGARPRAPRARPVPACGRDPCPPRAPASRRSPRARWADRRWDGRTRTSPRPRRSPPGTGGAAPRPGRS